MNPTTMIVDRECPVECSDSQVIAAIYSRMRPEAKRAASRTIRRRAYADALARHHANQQEYAAIMSGRLDMLPDPEATP